MIADVRGIALAFVLGAVVCSSSSFAEGTGAASGRAWTDPPVRGTAAPVGEPAKTVPAKPPETAAAPPPGGSDTKKAETDPKADPTSTAKNDVERKTDDAKKGEDGTKVETAANPPPAPAAGPVAAVARRAQFTPEQIRQYWARVRFARAAALAAQARQREQYRARVAAGRFDRVQQLAKVGVGPERQRVTQRRLDRYPVYAGGYGAAPDYGRERIYARRYAGWGELLRDNPAARARAVAFQPWGGPVFGDPDQPY